MLPLAPPVLQTLPPFPVWTPGCPHLARPSTCSVLCLLSKPHCTLHLIPLLISTPFIFLPFFPTMYPSFSDCTHSTKQLRIPACSMKLSLAAVALTNFPFLNSVPITHFDSSLIASRGPVLPLQLCCRALRGERACVPSICPQQSHVKRSGCWVVAWPGLKSNTCVIRGEMIGWGLGGSEGVLIQRQEITWGRGNSN